MEVHVYLLQAIRVQADIPLLHELNMEMNDVIINSSINSTHQVLQPSGAVYDEPLG